LANLAPRGFVCRLYRRGGQAFELLLGQARKLHCMARVARRYARRLEQLVEIELLSKAARDGLAAREPLEAVLGQGGAAASAGVFTSRVRGSSEWFSKPFRRVSETPPNRGSRAIRLPKSRPFRTPLLPHGRESSARPSGGAGFRAALRTSPAESAAETVR
jgi:hypothetical protein